MRRALAITAVSIGLLTLGISRPSTAAESFPAVTDQRLLHAATDDLRDRLVPLNRAHPLAELVGGVHDRDDAETRFLLVRGKDVDVEYKSRLFRVAHDLAMSSFGMRQDIYEYWHAGDPSRNRINLLRAYDQSDITARIKDLCSQPLPHGDSA